MLSLYSSGSLLFSGGRDNVIRVWVGYPFALEPPHCMLMSTNTKMRKDSLLLREEPKPLDGMPQG